MHDRLTEPLDQPLPWGAAPGNGYGESPHPNDRWSRGNAGEVIPNVTTPLSWSVIGASLDRGFRVPWKPEWTEGRRFVALFDGYVYFNFGLILELIEDRLGVPSANFLEAIGGPDDASTGSRAFAWRKIVAELPFLLQSIRNQRRLPARWPAERAAAETERDRLRALELETRSDNQILRELARSGVVADRSVTFLMEAQAAVFNAVQTLLWTLEYTLGAEHKRLGLDVLQALPGVRTQDGNIALRRIAERAGADDQATVFVRQHRAESLWPALHAESLDPQLAWLRDALDAFMQEYGHRAAGELEASEPRWIEQPSLILETFRDYVLHSDAQSVEQLLDRQRNARRAAQREIRERLLQCGRGVGSVLWGIVRSQIEQAQALHPLRENPKFILLEVSLQQRRLWHELAQRWRERGWIERVEDVYFVEQDELLALARRGADPQHADQIRARIHRRRLQFELWKRQSPPPLRDPPRRTHRRSRRACACRRRAEPAAAPARDRRLRGHGRGARAHRRFSPRPAVN